MNDRWTREISAATGISISDDVTVHRDPVAGLEDLANTFGPALVLVRTRKLEQISPQLIDKAKDLGVRVGTWQGAADVFLTDGDRSHWENALNSGATVFSTAHPTAILEMLGR